MSSSPLSGPQDPSNEVSIWLAELARAEKEYESWESRAAKIVKRYRDEGEAISGGRSHFNILWSNIQTLKPAVYAHEPKATVERRYLDKDPIGRAASEILQRATQYTHTTYGLHETVSLCVDDYLLIGRGSAWARYEPKFEASLVLGESGLPVEDEGGEPLTEEKLKEEKVCFDYVAWKDFRHSPARHWGEVRWVARRVFLSKADIEKRFAEHLKLYPDALDKLPFDVGPDGEKEDSRQTTTFDELRRAEIWEIWAKDTMKAYWLAKGYDILLDSRDDPLKLGKFFPCPKPLFGTTTTDKLVPVPDYVQYQAQAEEIDDITVRIDKLIAACRVAGAYDASETALQGLFTSLQEPALIPVTNWATFAQSGGFKGMVDFIPLDVFVQQLRTLYEAREAAKQVIYEITGISDIMRGQGEASETATAQRIKGQFGTLRLQERQRAVSAFARDLIEIAGEIIAEHYDPETIKLISSAAEIESLQTEQPSPPDPATGQPSGPPTQVFDEQAFAQAVALLRDEKTRGYRIDIETDSTIEADLQAEKQARVEFLQAVGQFLGPAMEAVQTSPAMAPLLGKLLLFGVKGFRAGRGLEKDFEEAIEQLGQAAKQPPPPDPEAEKMKAEAEAETAKRQQDMEFAAKEHQQKLAFAKEEHEQNIALERDKQTQKAQLDNERFEHEMVSKSRAAQAEQELHSESEIMKLASNIPAQEEGDGLNELSVQVAEQGERIADVSEKLEKLGGMLEAIAAGMSAPQGRPVQ